MPRWLPTKSSVYTGRIDEVTGVVIKDGKTLVPNRQRKKACEARMALASTEDPEGYARLTAVLRGLDQQRKQVEGAGLGVSRFAAPSCLLRRH